MAAEGIMAELEMDEVRSIWTSQPTAPRAMSQQEMLDKANKLKFAGRSKLALFSALGILLVVFGVNDHDIRFAFGKFIVACLLVAGWETAYGFKNELDILSLGLNAGTSSSLAFYRSELLRRRSFFESHQRTLAPALFLVLGSLRFVALSLRSGAFINLTPLGVFLAGWLAFTVLRKRRELPAIENEILALNLIERR
jgi:hypothetical protein